MHDTKLQKGLAIGAQEGFADTFNDIVTALNGIHGEDGIVVKWIHGEIVIARDENADSGTILLNRAEGSDITADGIGPDGYSAHLNKDSDGPVAFDLSEPITLGVPSTNSIKLEGNACVTIDGTPDELDGSRLSLEEPITISFHYA